MKWLKKHWNENKEFRAAIVVVVTMALSAAGVPPALANAVSLITGTVTF